MGKFLKFEKMITPIFIQIFFWLGFIGSIISGFGMIGYGIISSSGGFSGVLIGLFSLFIGPIIIRVYCERLIVLFKVQGAWIDIIDALDAPNGIEQGKAA